MKKWHVIGIIAIILHAATSCGDNYTSSIPDVRVNFSCSLLNNPYYAIQSPGMFIPVSKANNNLPLGYAGLIIGQSVYYGEYYAFDAACPVEASRNIAVEVQEDGMGTAICPSCKTPYNLSGGGFPENAKTEALKRYKVIVNGSTLRVTN